MVIDVQGSKMGCPGRNSRTSTDSDIIFSSHGSLPYAFVF